MITETATATAKHLINTSFTLCSNLYKRLTGQSDAMDNERLMQILSDETVFNSVSQGDWSDVRTNLHNLYEIINGLALPGRKTQKQQEEENKKGLVPLTKSEQSSAKRMGYAVIGVLGVALLVYIITRRK